MPLVYLYNGKEGGEHFNADPRLQHEKQAAPICIPLLVGAGIAGATAIGALVLMAGNENLRELSK